MKGITGHLLSHAFLDSRFGAAIDGDAPSAAESLRVCRTIAGALGPAATVRALLFAGAAPLVAALGFDPPTDVSDVASVLTATATANGGRIALLVAPFGEPLEPLWRTAVTEALRRSADWCLLFNGTHLRIVDAARVYARRYLEFDLDLAMADARTRAVLAHTVNAIALTGEFGSPLRSMVAASDRHGAGVCRALRDGVLAASRDIIDALVAPRGRRTRPPLGDSFEQALTIVYRLLFLLFAEARLLVPLWHPVYRDGYSVEALRAAAERSPHAVGMWDALRAMARLAHTGCRAGDLRVTPFNGRLFAPARTPLAERTDLDDAKARSAVLALSTRSDGGRGRERITYRDLGVEQLGAVYETLLDYEPRVAAGRVTLAPESGVRKATGTFYTPQPIAEYLVRRTLAPLVDGRSADDILRLRIVDPSMGSGAFLVAACRYLAQAYERALIDAGSCHAADLDESDRARFRRLVAERSLYGVDLNPMAVQLARLSLWLATLAADRPLSFLDHRLLVGDSVVGAWLAQLRCAPNPRRRARAASALPLFEVDAAADAVREALPLRFSLESIPNDTLAQVRAKERAHAAATARDAELSRWKRIADAWCAAWFASADRAVPEAAFAAMADAILGRGSALPERFSRAYLDAADGIARSRRFFHWELECPEVFFAEAGRRLENAGFDAVIGNPPWDVIQDRDLLRFTRVAGAYVAQGDGHANQYQLFVERAMALTRCGGRIGLVLPSGLASDHGSAALRRALLTRCDVDALVGFDNHRAVFPIHRSVRFVLLSATSGAQTSSIACRLGLDDPAALEAIGDEPPLRSPWYRVRLSVDTLQRISGAELTIPHVTSPLDLEIAERAAALFAPLGSRDGWSARFGRELNATDDRAAFRESGRGLPIVDGKHLSPFRVDVARSLRTIAAAEARRRLGSDRYERARLAYRDVASSTNRVTLIAAVLPRGCVSTHTVFCLRTPLSLVQQHFLCGLFNSLVVNFLVRLRVTTHVTTAIVERLPIPAMDTAPAAAAEIAAMARWLARRDDEQVVAQLNARVAALYQLTRAEVEHVLSTFPLIDRSARDRVLCACSSLL